MLKSMLCQPRLTLGLLQMFLKPHDPMNTGYYEHVTYVLTLLNIER